MPAPATSHPDWPEALATVLTCTYSARAGRAIAFGLPSSRHFHITYNYFAEGELHTGDFFSEKAIPQGSLFPIRYHPDEPHRNHPRQGRRGPGPPSSPSASQARSFSRWPGSCSCAAVTESAY